jgi:hypothetical protein
MLTALIICVEGVTIECVMQAGQIQGRVFYSMKSALRSGGFGALYSGHMAFLMQGLPYDVAELVTYSQLRAVKGPLRCMPRELRDMLIGDQSA